MLLISEKSLTLCDTHYSGSHKRGSVFGLLLLFLNSFLELLAQLDRSSLRPSHAPSLLEL